MRRRSARGHGKTHAAWAVGRWPTSAPTSISSSGFSSSGQIFIPGGGGERKTVGNGLENGRKRHAGHMKKSFFREAQPCII